jgi:general secretion pathway protein K
MVGVAVLTALAVDLAYDTRVSLQIAANARDELRATYLAKSGVALSRLVLSFQQEVDEMPKMGQLSLPKPQIWRLVPVGTELASALFGGDAPAGAPARPEGLPEGSAVAGPPEGGFEAVLDDEGRKVNVQLEAQSTGFLAPQAQAVWQLVCDPRWDALFDREDENGIRVSRQDLLVHLRDWVDEDEVGSALDAAFPPGGCVMLAAQNPFPPGFGDENFPYDRGEDRYRAKNARMDSLAELHLVAGVTDAFMAAFEDAMTVYLPRDAKRNVNEIDRARLLDLAALVADPPGQPVLLDPAFAELLQRAVFDRTLGGLLSITPLEFGQMLQSLGVSVDVNRLKETSPQNPFTDRSSVFHIRAAGRAGGVTKRLDAVVRYDKPVAGQVVTIPGRLVHWREE